MSTARAARLAQHAFRIKLVTHQNVTRTLAAAQPESNVVNSQHIIYCNSFSTFVSWSYTNTVTASATKTPASATKTSASATKTSASTSQESTDSLSTGTGTSSSSSTTATATTGTSTPTPTPSKTTLTTGALVGIGVGGVAAVALIVALLFWFCKRSPKGKYGHAPSMISGHNSYDPRSSLPTQYAPIPFDSTSKYQYQSPSASGIAELSPSMVAAPPPANEHPAYHQYGYTNSGRQSPAPGPEAYLLPVVQQPQHQPHDQPAPGPYAQYHQQLKSPQYPPYQPVSPPTQHLPGYESNNRNSNRDTRSTVSELGDTSSTTAFSSTASLSATGAVGYVSPEDAWRTGRVAP
ncbi:MAG: hypothetical protein M1840_005426 [Geoglossum simile]|nr:MAG: hypothetical protein M1840_005426 [Geoglossum simile]